ncbi:phage major capsid protein [Candidatus Parcubacteria bacterium]|nr:MAG: phage major capsid protein [Candidatus Parcubacteria bacterium]
MEKINKLREEYSKLLDELHALADVSEKEKRDFTEDESNKWNEIEKRLAEIKSNISRLEKLQEYDAEAKERAVEPVRVEVVREHNHNEEGEYRGFKSLGEQLAAVAASMTPGARTDKRLVEMRAATGASEAIGSDGGFLVQSDFTAELMNGVMEDSRLASEAREVPLSGNSNELVLTLVDETSRATGSRFGGVQAYWRAEGDAVTATKPKLRRERLQAQSLDALFYATEELLEDASALGSLAETAFRQEIAWLLDDAILNGDGAGKPLGILNSGALISVTRNTSSDIKYEDIDAMVDRMWARGEDRAVWYVHKNAKQKLRNAVKVGTNTDFLLYMPAGGISGNQFDSLYGRPVRSLEQAKDVGNPGDVLFLDMSQYLLVRKGGIRGAQSAHVRFIYSEMTFKWSVRVNGMPLWNSPVTDANGSTTRSPFIAIAA